MKKRTSNQERMFRNLAFRRLFSSAGSGGVNPKVKRKVALCVGYDGERFLGSQRQADDLPTVSQHIEKALLKEEMVLPTNMTPARLHWEASSRTGVSIDLID
jgi:hypothetical protein